MMVYFGAVTRKRVEIYACSFLVRIRNLHCFNQYIQLCLTLLLLPSTNGREVIHDGRRISACKLVLCPRFDTLHILRNLMVDK